MVAYNVISAIILVSIVITVLGKYMTINKIWVRKHEKEVADSVSVSALILELVYTVPFLFVSIKHFDPNFLMKNSADVIRDLVAIVVGVVLFLIGVGYWINNGLSFKDKFYRALKMDRKEFKSLLKDVVNPGGINNIFRVLCMFAIVDNELHEKEVELLKQFAGEYNLDYEATMTEVQKEFANSSDAMTMNHLQQQVLDYISTSPPKNIIIWLQDLIDKIIRADDIITEEEEIVSSEILAALNHYLDGSDKKIQMHHILLIPQDKEEEDAILAIDSKLEKSKAQIFGSKKAYVADSYFSERFAEIVREKYVNLFKCFVTIEKY